MCPFTRGTHREWEVNDKPQQLTFLTLVEIMLEHGRSCFSIFFFLSSPATKSLF